MNKVRLDKVATFYNGRAFKPEEWQSNGLPIIRIQNLTGSSDEINYFDGEYDERNFVRRGDILISWSASLGVYEWQGRDALLNQHIFKVELKDSIQKNYFYHAATHLLNEMRSHVHGSTMQHITKDRFDVLEIPLPSRDEQKRIAAFLDKADRLRRQRRFAQTLSDSFLQSVFIKMFGELLINDLKWPETIIESVATKVTDGEHATPIRIAKGIKLLSARNVKNGYIDLNAGLDFISEDEHLRIKKRCNPEFDDVLLSCSGTVGRASTVDIREPFSLVRSVALIKPDKTKILPKYLEHYLRSNYAQRLISISANQSSQANIFIEPIKNLTVLLPPLPLQEKFAAIVQKFERIRRQQREATRQAEHLFQTLLHRAFRSEL